VYRVQARSFDGVCESESMMELDKIICGHNAGFPDACIDLTVTSPPYDNLRTYNGYNFDFEGVAQQLYRVAKPGGVIVWVVGDATVNGSETGTSFRQALYFMECGFNLHDTMIYEKDTIPFPEVNRYEQAAQFMFVFSKGSPRTFTGLLEKTRGYKPSRSSSSRQADGSTQKLKYEQGKQTRKRFNIWRYGTGYMKSTQDSYAFEHPAMFPESLASDHILSWSNPDDVVLVCRFRHYRKDGKTKRASLDWN
jgi:site-specific DNA-methyltransferase (adenine-specific)